MHKQKKKTIKMTREIGKLYYYILLYAEERKDKTIKGL